MVTGFSQNLRFSESFKAFSRMRSVGESPTQFAFASIIRACVVLGSVEVGRQLHSFALKLGLACELFVGSNLVDMYLKCGFMVDACKVFEEIPSKDAASWTSMIDGYTKSGDLRQLYGTCQFGIGSRNIVSYSSPINGYVKIDEIKKAFSVSVDLQRGVGVEPNQFTFSNLVKACTSQAALEQGIQLHAKVVKFNFDRDNFVPSVLVDMYGKCGLLNHSIQVFDEVATPTQVAWNSLLSAFAVHGLGNDVLKTFSRMVQARVKPNAITFISLLTGCSHSGLVEESLKYFYSMEKTYGIVPRAGHYSCIIGLLGGAKRLEKAEDFINSMRMQPNTFGWFLHHSW
ncbi:pentatricopeptide repeat-containing protein At5g66520 [Rosa chinensis]|uniref:pentatricopeptide repeat-containing protein At5g66520 n=1 Tax=Rosa chinensis TaxID=74649 RepID=UPI000D095B82|nr:pentatricopeptide repeat-containing protein At5g66520 [Rosa chinensis]